MESKPNSSMQFPPGFRFHPSDEELIIHYLSNKAASRPIPASVIADIDLYKYNPWELPMKALFGEEEWYFFTPRDRKYPNGARPNRSAASGYWKATGTDKPILTSIGSKTVGVKKALVFYKGRPPKGVKTDWIMHEYRLLDAMIWNSKRKGSLRLDDWVLCRVRQKSSNARNNWEEYQHGPSFEPISNIPNTDESYSANTNLNIEMMRKYQFKDCPLPLLPYILASQDLLSTETASSMSFEGSNNGNTPTSANKNNPDKNLQCSISSFDSYMFNPQKKRRMEHEQLQSDKILPSRSIGHNEKEEVNGMIFYGTNQSEGNSTEANSFFADEWNPRMYQELNQLNFTESD